jgi:zinc protease
MANLAFHELVYDGHPYGRSSSGYLETVATLTPPVLADFHARFYGPQRMIVVVAGAVKAEAAVAKVTAVLGDWQNEGQEMMTAVPDMPRPETQLYCHVPMPNKQQADLRLGLPGPARSAPDYLDASLMNTVLGVFGMMGRIGLKVREEQGLAYYAYSQLQGGHGPSPWIAAAGVAPEAVAQATQSILDEVTRMQNEPVTADELADNKAYRTGSLPMALETNSGLADVIMDMELFELGLDYLAEFPQKIQAITPERIQMAAQKYLSTEQIGVAVAGP